MKKQTEQSPTDASLYYKRATAQFSLNRYSSALTDYDQVLHLTSNTFDRAHLMKAKIHLRLGSFSLARDALRSYTSSPSSPSNPSSKSNNEDPDAMALLLDVGDAESTLR